MSSLSLSLIYVYICKHTHFMCLVASTVMIQRLTPDSRAPAKQSWHHVGPMLGLCWPMLGLCWPMLSLLDLLLLLLLLLPCLLLARAACSRSFFVLPLAACFFLSIFFSSSSSSSAASCVLAPCSCSLIVFSFPFFPRAFERRVLLIVGVCQTFSHLHIFTSSLHIFSSSHFLIFTSSHLLIFTSSHLHFTSSHLHICTSSHLLIFTSSHLHIFSSSHLHILTSSHLHILTSSHLLIFTSSHLHIFTSSHLHILSCPLAFFSISLLRRGAVPTRWHETQPFRTKRGSIAKNCGEITILKCETRFDRQKNK